MALGSKFASGAQTTLNGSIDDSVTTLTVTDRSSFPDINSDSEAFLCRIVAEGSNTDEIIAVLSNTSDTWNISRGADIYNGSNTPSAHASGATIQQVLSGADMQAVANGIIYPQSEPTLVETVDWSSGTGTISLTSTPNANDLLILINTDHQHQVTGVSGGGVTTWINIGTAANQGGNYAILQMWLGLVDDTPATTVTTSYANGANNPYKLLMNWRGGSIWPDGTGGLFGVVEKSYALGWGYSGVDPIYAGILSPHYGRLAIAAALSRNGSISVDGSHTTVGSTGREAVASYQFVRGPNGFYAGATSMTSSSPVWTPGGTDNFAFVHAIIY